MKIYHIRKLSGHDTDFRPTIINSIMKAGSYKNNNPNDKIDVYIASGFFENVSSFSTNTPNLQQVVSGIDHLYLIGAYNGTNGIMQLGQQLVPQFGQINAVSAYYKSRFHAKIFVITKNDKPVFEIIGSSNMTNVAYCGRNSNGRLSPNFECDLIICDEQIIDLPIDISPTTMQFRYIDDDNNGIPIDKRMSDIFQILQGIINDPKTKKII